MIRYAILEVLRARTGEWCRPRTVADQTFVGLGEVSAAVQELRRTGYEVEDHPHLGYRLLGPVRRLIPYEMTRGLGTAIIGRQILAFDRVTSTNDIAWAQASAGCAEGTAICAEEQSAGRGRMGRQWTCPPGKGLLTSIVLRPRLEVAKQSALTVMTAVAAALTIQERFALPALIRWPNDLMIRGRKAGGILVEARSLSSGPAFVVGIGANATQQETDFPPELRAIATSLAIEAGRGVDRNDFARHLFRSLDRWYQFVLRGDYDAIAENWRHMSSTLGQRVVLTDGLQQYRGRVLDLTLEDGLILRLDSGVTRLFPAAQVTLVHEGGQEG